MIKLIRKIAFYLFIIYILVLIFLNLAGYWDQPSQKIKLDNTLLNKHTTITGQIITPPYLYTRFYKKGISFTIKYKNKTNIFIDTYPTKKYTASLGDIIQITGKIKLINPHNKYSSRHKYKKIYYKISNYSLNTYKYLDKGPRLLQFFGKIRNTLLSSIATLYQGISSEIIPAITLGDKTFLSKQSKQFIRGIGLGHIIAISGMHIGFIYGFLLLLFRKKLNIYFAISAFILLWSYTCIVGFPPSCIRAATMLSLITIATLLERKALSLNSLTLSAMIMLLINPRQLFLIGFQLSFLGVFSILYFYQFWQIFFKKIFNRVNPISSSISYPRPIIFLLTPFKIFYKIFLVSISVQSFLAPLTLLYFQKVNALGIIFNLIFTPFLGFMLIGGIISSIFGLFFKPLAHLFALLTTFLVEKLFGACNFFYENTNLFIELKTTDAINIVILMSAMLFIPIIKRIAKNKFFIILFYLWVGIYFITFLI
ncbi:MAG: ComEC/Rec2 family competence protein [bacterium]|nr:ComEC/Rec2 family competence protein [bacterium]